MKEKPLPFAGAIALAYVATDRMIYSVCAYAQMRAHEPHYAQVRAYVPHEYRLFRRSQHPSPNKPPQWLCVNLGGLSRSGWIGVDVFPFKHVHLTIGIDRPRILRNKARNSALRSGTC